MFAALSNVRLRWKILFAPAFLIAVLIGFGVYALRMQERDQTTVNALIAGPVRHAEAVADFSDAVLASEIQLYRLMAIAANDSDDDKKIKALADHTTAALADTNAKAAVLAGLGFSDPKAVQDIDKLKAAVAEYVKKAKSVVDMADGDAGTALMLMQGAANSFNTIEDITADLSAISKQLRDRRVTDNNAELEQQKSLLIGVLLAALAFSTLMALLVSRGIAKPVVGIAAAIGRMAEGDFDLILPGLGRRDEIGRIAAAVERLKQTAAEKARRDAEEAAARQAEAVEAQARQERDAAALQAEAAAERAKAAEEQAGVLMRLAAALKSLSDGDLTVALDDGFSGDHRRIRDDFNAAAVRLHGAIRTISHLAHEVANATAEISTSTTHLSERTEEQAASLEQTAASMEEIAATVRKNAENAQAANQSAATTRDVADRGGAVVAQAVEAMARIEESSRKISDIIGVIDEIARQTNLLALNAAVEAARAGEAGRGFAVVASEVRGLAQRSSQAAKDIKNLITGSSGEVKEGVDLVNRAGTALSEIVESIKSVTTTVAEIASASAEQASGIDQVNKALARMDEVTQQNSALVEENAATAKALEQQARAMDEQVAFFHLDQATAIAPPAPPPAVVAMPAPPQAKPAPVKVAGMRAVGRGGAAAAAVAGPDWKEF